MKIVNYRITSIIWFEYLYIVFADACICVDTIKISMKILITNYMGMVIIAGQGKGRSVLRTWQFQNVVF